MASYCIAGPDIYELFSLRQNGLMPVKWQENLLAKENPKRNDYIQALKKADQSDFSDLISMHQQTY
jgi:hypothetical protein